MVLVGFLRHARSTGFFDARGHSFTFQWNAIISLYRHLDMRDRLRWVSLVDIWPDLALPLRWIIRMWWSSDRGLRERILFGKYGRSAWYAFLVPFWWVHSNILRDMLAHHYTQHTLLNGMVHLLLCKLQEPVRWSVSWHTSPSRWTTICYWVQYLLL